MATSSPFVSKQKVLQESENRVSYSSWEETLCYHISNEPKFSRFLNDLSNWEPTSTDHRGFTDDADASHGIKMNAQTKAINLKVLLGYISIHAPVINSNFIKDEARSINDIFIRLREYYDCKKSGIKITELLDFRIEPLETREALWERVYGFMEDSLITVASGVKHRGAVLAKDEHLTPTLLNICVIIWLDAIHKSLPLLVKQRFAITLRDTSIYSIRSQISDAIPSLLLELGEREGNISYANSGFRKGKQDRFKGRQRNRPKCCLCEAASRPGADTHFFQTCPFLPANDRKFLKSKIGEVDIHSNSESEDDEYTTSSSKSIHLKSPPPPVESKITRVEIISSPCMEVTINDKDADITLDTGAESNLIHKREARHLNLKVQPTSHRATQADGVTPMDVAGEVHFTVSRICSITKKTHSLQFNGVVVNTLNCSILGGVPFLENNDIHLRPAINSVYVADCCGFKYSSIRRSASVRAARIMRVTRQKCLLPGSSMSWQLPPEYQDDFISIEPRITSDKGSWIKCQVVKSTDKVSIENETSYPVLLKRHEHLFQIRHTEDRINIRQEPTSAPKPIIYSTKGIDRSADVAIDPSNILKPQEKLQFTSINQKYSKVFDSSLGCYNGKSGPFKMKINMSSSLPPQRRGRLPIYSRSNLEELQLKFDELYAQGVFVRPEDVNVTAEYVNPSFLVAKSSGGHRLVTAFAELGQYAKPQPSQMPKVEEVISQVGQYKYIIKSDLSSAYYQIVLDKPSLKYVGVCTPFRGVYVYTRAVMGLPGSESALEQLMSKVLGDLMMNGSVTKLADDLYVGADTPENLMSIWENVLNLLQLNNLRLSPSKTVICPTSTEILGWQWEQGSLRATPHRLNTLAICDPPQTVAGLRSFIGSYKFLSKVLPKHSDMLAPLDKVCAGSSSKDKVQWSSDLEECFIKAKEHLKNAKTLTLPKRNDKLQVITDAASTNAGLASSLYIIRNGRAHLGGLFNARKTTNQQGWLACELEALGIAASVKHFSPYIVQSEYTTDVLTDSRPCVQAYGKLMRGAFSASSRVNTFLATISRYNVKLSHISGKDNCISDYGSRNALECTGNCQICKFIKDIENSVVREVSVEDIITGRCPIPYMTRSTWIQTQQESPELQQVYRLLRDGRVPSRKRKGMTEVKKYLQHCRLSTSPDDGLLIVSQEMPLSPTRQRIVVPKEVLEGLLTVLHIQLNHPSKYQLKQVFNRGFFALSSDKAIANTVDGCHTCASLKSIPCQFKQQSTTLPPDKLGRSYAGDVVKRDSQLIFLLRENVSSFTDGVLIKNETAQCLRDALLRTITRFSPPSQAAILVRIDGATGFSPLKLDPTLKSMHITLEVGEAKNINHNPIAERSISEFHTELLKIKPSGGVISEAELALIIANMNSRIRQTGYSAAEIWTQRDMVTGDKLPIIDEKLAGDKYKARLSQHQTSAKYKGRGRTAEKQCNHSVGDIIYLYQDRNKTKGRERYMIMKKNTDGSYEVQKFTDKQFRGKRYKVRGCDIIKVRQYDCPDSESDENVYQHITDISNHQSDRSQEEHDITESTDSDTSKSDSDEYHTEEAEAPNRRPVRERKAPKYLEDYDLNQDE